MPSYRRPPLTEGASSRRRRHAVAAGLIAGYLAAAVCAVAAHRLVAVPQWLALHLLVLGAASNAVFVYSRHFAQALLHARPGSERPAHARLAGFNLGAVAVLTGMSAGLPWLAVAGAVLVITAVIAHTVSLVGMARAASRSGRLRIVAWYYVAAGTALAIGATLGGLMAGGAVRSTRWEQALLLAHAHLNLLGWLGLVVVGTLFMLWPAVLRTRMADTAPRCARQVLVITVIGLAVAVAGELLSGLLTPAHWPAAVGMGGYTAGVAYSLRPVVAEVRVKPPRTAAPGALLAGTGWLLAALTVDVVGLALGNATAVGLLGRLLVPMLGIGVVAQILTGALTFLLPVTVGGGPVGNRRMTEVLEHAWVPRSLFANLGVLLLALPTSGGPRVLAWTLVVIGIGSFPALVVASLLAVRRPATSTGGDTTDAPVRRKRPAGRTTLAVGSVIAVIAVLALIGAGTGIWSGHTTDATSGSATTATSGVPVSVTLDEFSVTPSTITVAPGTDLTVTVHNVGGMSHNLVLDGRHGTRMLAPGGKQTVDLGTVTHDERAWCTVPGHRAAGMVLTIRTTTSTSPRAATRQNPNPSMPGMDMSGRDASPSPAWRPYDPTLRPAPGGTEHHLTLRVEQTTVEVSPGVRQRVWTYNGTVPGPVLHGRVGDLFTVRVINSGNMPHSIDFHASQVAPDTAMRDIPPGGELTYQFRADHAGAWLYHCATAPMIQHLAMGMYGAVIIDPPTLGRVAVSEVLVQSEFYLGAKGGVPTMSQLLAAKPDLVVFNGYADQYRHAPIHVPAGKRIRLWLVDAGPNEPSAFHVVGAQFDTVFKEGAYQLKPGNPAHGAAQELDLQPGEGGFVEFTLPQRGTYTLTTHRLADAERGAMGTIVAGP
ncbi:multicopper oxidase domain-containing protein [Streptomyces sp. HUAS TT20]|uniref:multicopper oxidase domain-containing protein n=1 Tax=Streptomyces sp. HUAS TT20 TaxID=3447509 RepID=UPI0021D8EB96|nr:multicopper oxidase domain-containing protein [Streptomyces sp. HUAS 15-9]UXY25322.1 multicopper oxidase domain-containing protein [Streptomyces sp. HUAS 15-9]